MRKPILIICGPTASGKSAVALEVASKQDGAIINADSMQIYREFPLLSCSPSLTDQQLCPHYLYNFLPATKNYSMANFVDDALEAIAVTENNNKLPIIVGGTGLYIKALCEGFSNIPPIDTKVRAECRELYQNLGKEAFFKRLEAIDPIAANKLHINNTQRLIRAYEVMLATGQSLFTYQNEVSPLAHHKVTIIVLDPDREFLYQSCNKRFQSLVATGAIAEIEANLFSLPAMNFMAQKTIGIKELVGFLRGEQSLEKAIELAMARTRQYAKRQVTWFKHQLEGAYFIKFSNIKEQQLVSNQIVDIIN